MQLFYWYGRLCLAWTWFQWFLPIEISGNHFSVAINQAFGFFFDVELKLMRKGINVSILATSQPVFELTLRLYYTTNVCKAWFSYYRCSFCQREREREERNMFHCSWFIKNMGKMHYKIGRSLCDIPTIRLDSMLPICLSSTIMQNLMQQKVQTT